MLRSSLHHDALMRSLLRSRNVAFRTVQRRTQSTKANTDAAASCSAASPAKSKSLPIWYRLGPLTQAFQAYGRVGRRRPYITQVCTSLFIYLCADISAQRISKKEYDPVRTVRSMGIGAVAAIPAYEWFLYLSLNFNFASKLISLTTKIIINQLVFTPVFGTYFFGAQALLSGASAADTWDRIKTAVPISFINAWKVWPAVMAFNFTYVPLEFRSIFAGMFAVGWQTYLTWLNRRTEDAEAARRSTINDGVGELEAQAA